MTAKPPTSLQLYLLPPGPCPYLAGRTEQKAATLLDKGGADIAALLIERGFRRSQGMFYRQRCPACSACLPARIRLADFAPSAAFRRVLGKNRDLSFAVGPPAASPALYDLFIRYLKARHGEEGMAEMSYDSFALMMKDSPVQTRFMTARDETGAVMGVMLFDETPDGVSAVYSFFEPGADRRSLGTCLILKLAEYTAKGGKPYLYLGFWVKDSPGMAYKSRFQPLEVFMDERWVDFSSAPLTAPAGTGCF